MNKLTVISGADVGASCYLLEMFGVRLLFDCGTRVGCAYTEHPDIPDPETIDAIFISHAHIDHMGAIAYTAAVCKNAKIYMTDLTKSFVRYQLAATIAEYIGADTDDLRFNNRILCELIMNRVQTVQFEQKLSFVALNGEQCAFSLFGAGHVPGAAMLYIKIKGKKVLYTGDFAAVDTSLTYPYRVPDSVNPDIMIVCGTHANQPDYEFLGNNALDGVIQNLYNAAARNLKLVIPVSQLTKGLELIAMLEEMIEAGEFRTSKIFLEENFWGLAQYYENKSETFRLPSYVKPLNEWKDERNPQMPIIIFEAAGCNMRKYPNYTKLNSDFTLHADYEDIMDLIMNCRPKKVYIVHAANGDGALCEETLHTELECLVYTENGKTYELS